MCRVKEREKQKPEGEINYPKKHRVIRVYRLDEEGNEIILDGDGEEEILEAEEESDTPRKKRRKSELS